jgi:predicted lipoprotein
MMDNKKISILSVVMVLLIIGVVCLSGCQIQNCPNPDEKKPVVVGCILQNPDKYLNKTVIIKGVFGTNQNRTWVHTQSIYFGHVPDDFNIVMSNNVNTSILVPWKEYYFTGIVRAFTEGQEGFHQYYLEVIKIQLI